MRGSLFVLGLLAALCYPVAAQQSKDQAAIRSQETRWQQVVIKKDTAAIGSYYTDDGIYAPDNATAAFVGRDAVTARWADEFRLPEFRLIRTPTRLNIASSGDLAQEIGTYRVHILRDGKPYEGQGNYVTSWRKVGGQWKIASYIWNADTAGHGRMCERQCEASRK